MVYHIMLMGAQRSGTNALFDSLAADQKFSPYNEWHPDAFDNYFLKPEPALREIMQTPCIFKPISEAETLGFVFEAGYSLLHQVAGVLLGQMTRHKLLQVAGSLHFQDTARPAVISGINSVSKIIHKK